MSIVWGIIFFVALLAVWQGAYFLFVTVLELAKPYMFPSPLGVWESLVGLCQKGTLFEAIGYSLLRGIIGFAIAVVIGVIFGLLLRLNFFQRYIKPIILGIQTLPSVCWVPFSILWFGLSQQAILFVVVMGSTFSVALSVDNAIKNVPPIYTRAALTMGANKLQIYKNVYFPACLPEFVSGLKQGWSFAWRALMAGEVMTTSIGLGQTLITGRDLNDINQVMLVMIVIVAVGIIIDKLIFTTIENRLLRKRGLLAE